MSTRSSVAGPSAAQALRRANQALVVAAGAMFVVSFVTTASNIAIPVLETAFPDASLSTVSWVVSAFNVTQVTFMLLGGRLADRWGRRRVFLAGMAVFCLGAALSAVAPVIGLVIASRVVQAIGVAMVLPSSLAAVLPLFPLERHASVVSLWSAMGILGSALAPTMAAGVLQLGSWRLVFATVIPFAALAWWGGRARLEDGVVPAEPAPLDLLGTLAGTLAVGGDVLAHRFNIAFIKNGLASTPWFYHQTRDAFGLVAMKPAIDTDITHPHDMTNILGCPTVGFE